MVMMMVVVMVAIAPPPVMMMVVVMMIEELTKLSSRLPGPLRVLSFQRGDGIGNWSEQLLVRVCDGSALNGYRSICGGHGR